MNIHEIKRLTEEAMNARKVPYGEGSKEGYKDWKENLHQKEFSLKEAKAESALRDWFAGMAMCGDWSHPEAIINDYDKAAEDYYKMADAMMEARKK